MGRRNVKNAMTANIKILAGIVALLVLVMALPSAQAQSLFPNFGDQRVGTSAMTFLKIPVGSRAEGLGGAYVAIANDAFASFWNPGGIAQIYNRWNGAYTVDPQRPAEGVKGPRTGINRLSGGRYSVGLVSFKWIGDLSYSAVSAVMPISIGAIGVSAISLQAPDQEITTEYHPDGTGEYYSYGDVQIGATFAWEMTQNFSWGITLKGVRETLADTQMDNVMFDIGTYYWTGYRDLRIGVALMHFGPNASPKGSFLAPDPNGDIVETGFTEFSPPTEFRVGAAMTLFASGPHRLLASFQLNHPVDNSENFVTGAEYSFAGQFYIRGGLKANTDEDPWTVGAGLRLPFSTKAMSVDVSYTEFGLLDQVTRLSLEFSF
ncbi:MAG: PorV/PorQ family protein [bacterium]